MRVVCEYCGSIYQVAESEVKYPTFTKFPTPNIKGMKFGC